MPKEIENADGTKETLFTQEELDAKAADEVAAKVAEAESKAADEKTELETKLAEATEKLTKELDKTRNFEALRDKLGKKEDNGSDLAKTVDNLSKQLDEINRRPVEEAKNDFITKNIGTNKELKDKFDVFFGKLGSDAKTKVEVEAAMSAAFILASDGKKPDISTRMQRGSVNDNFAELSDGQETEMSREIASKMGLTEEDKKKYGKGAKVDLIKPTPIAKK